MTADDFKFTETDARAISDKLKNLYVAIRRAAGESAYRLFDGDPVRMLLETQSAACTQVALDIDLTGKSNLLHFANEDTIEYIGELYGSRGARLQPAPARTTIRYHLSALRTSATIIPEGSRTTPDNQLFFATMRTLQIPAGELYGDVDAICMTNGVIGNGFDAGDVNNMVDLFPFVVSAENIVVTSGGADVENLEAYRERIRLAPESFSVAGPDGAYEFWAKTAHPGISDTRVWMPELDLVSFAAFLAPWGISDTTGFYTALFNYFRESGTGPGNVNIAVLMQDGELPTEEVKKQVLETLSDKRVRPLTDFVHVKDPQAVEYGIIAKYWIRTEDATIAQSIIESVDLAVQRFIAWQKNNLGRDINPSFLHQSIMECGVKWVKIEEPLPKKLEPWQVGILGDTPVQVTFEGLEDE